MNSGCSASRTSYPEVGSSRTSRAEIFKQYHRVWKLQPAGSGNQTRAEFELLVEVETIVPNWVVAVAMERELNAHFRIVRQKALDRVTKEK